MAEEIDAHEELMYSVRCGWLKMDLDEQGEEIFWPTEDGKRLLDD